MAPGDPIDNLVNEEFGFESGEIIRENIAKRLGLDKPNFYLNFTSSAYPDTLFNIKSRYKRENLQKLIAQYGNWPQIQNYYQKIRALQIQIDAIPDTFARDQMINIEKAANLLFVKFQDNQISAQVLKMKKNALQCIQLNKSFGIAIDSKINDLEQAYLVVKEEATPNLLYIPTIHWYGFDNQYHNWITAFLHGDFGISYRDGQKVEARLKTPIYWTLIMNLMGITIAFLVSIPMGVYSATKRNSFFDKATTVGLFVLYSLPTFWIGTLLVVFFTNPEYGMDWFCGIGLGNVPTEAPFWTRFWTTACHLVLPVFCITYPSFAFISRQMRGSMLETIRQDYIRTAKAKGLEIIRSSGSMLLEMHFSH